MMDQKSLEKLAERLREAGTDSEREAALKAAHEGRQADGRAGRDAVAHTMLTARTPEEVRAAGARAQAWIRDHPEDADYLAEAGESLEIVRRAQEGTGRGASAAGDGSVGGAG